MGISEGKIELYTAAAGVDPAVCLPVCLDVGTNNRALREHPEYGGLRRPRPTGQEYASFVDEFMTALKVRVCACVQRCGSGVCITRPPGQKDTVCVDVSGCMCMSGMSCICMSGV